MRLLSKPPSDVVFPLIIVVSLMCVCFFAGYDNGYDDGAEDVKEIYKKEIERQIEMKVKCWVDKFDLEEKTK